jgi:hypothetical protein
VVEILSLALVFGRGSNFNQPRQVKLVGNHSITQFLLTSRITGKGKVFYALSVMKIVVVNDVTYTGELLLG